MGMMEQNGGVVPSKPSKPIKTVPSAVSRITVEKVTDDQHDANYHSVSTVPSSMSRIERGRPASDDQYDSNFKTIQALPQSKYKIQVSPESMNSKYRTVRSSTMSYNKQSTISSGQPDPYYE